MSHQKAQGRLCSHGLPSSLIAGLYTSDGVQWVREALRRGFAPRNPWRVWSGAAGRPDMSGREEVNNQGKESLGPTRAKLEERVP